MHGIFFKSCIFHKTFLLSISYIHYSLKCIISQEGTPCILDGIKNTYTDRRHNKKSLSGYFRDFIKIIKLIRLCVDALSEFLHIHTDWTMWFMLVILLFSYWSGSGSYKSIVISFLIWNTLYHLQFICSIIAKLKLSSIFFWHCSLKWTAVYIRA